MKRRRRTLIIPVLLAGVTATFALAQTNSSSSSSSFRSDRSDRSSSRSDRDSRRSDRSSRSSRYSSSYASATTQPGGFLDGYRLVLDRNIFSRNRVIYRESSAGPTTAPTGGSYRSLPALSLTGVTEEGKAATAFVEDRRTNSTMFLHVGDAIADGKLTAINLDSIEYVTGAGKTVRVDLGQVIEGGPTYTVSSSGSSYPSYSSGAFGPTGGSPAGVSPSAAPGTTGPAPSGGGGGDTNDILERLRQKRLQETKR